jgi:Reverse transcriptase (RNA-dependent DNA polymerase)
MHFIIGTMIIYAGTMVESFNSWLIATWFMFVVGCTIYSNQPELCEITTWIDNVKKWWKHHKRKTRKRVRLQRSGYYIPGNKKEIARVCYLSSKGMARVRAYMYNVHPVMTSCGASTGVPNFYEEHKNIGIDTLSTYCMTNCIKDYIETPRNTYQSIKGISDSSAAVTKIGEGNFVLLDDQGMKCKIRIPELYYCSTAPYRIISPQHLDSMWRERGIGTFKESTCGTHTKISWVDEYGDSHTKTINHTTKSGVPVCVTAPCYDKYKEFLAQHQEYGYEEQEMISMISSTQVLQGYEQPISYDMTVTPPRNEYVLLRDFQDTKNDLKDLRKEPVLLDFHDQKEQETVEDEQVDDLAEMSVKTEKLFWHYKLGHTPFSAINRMAANGELPKRLLQATDPTCASCMYGQSTKRAWRTKAPATQVGERTKITRSGDCVSIDQMESPVPGLVAHMKGHPTKERYNCATVFVDHYSDVSFVHLQRSLGGDDTVEAKQAFERWCRSHNVTVRHYHADNGRFADNKFLSAVAMSGQTISFCGVNAHFQNGKAERRIRLLQDLARTQLLHAMARWPVAISTYLWPYAITNVCNCHNDQRRKEEQVTRIEKFTDSDIRPNLKNHHHIGIPTYVLDNDLQSGKKIPKWMPRARVGIYLGKSPRHARNVALVLNPRTGLVSPQFHVRFDDTFETVRGMREETHSLWKKKCGFAREDTKARKQIKSSTTTTKCSTGSETEKTVIQREEVELVERNENLQQNTTEDLRIHEGATNQMELDAFYDNEVMPNPEPAIQETRQNQVQQQPATRRSTRQHKPTQRMLESIEQEEMFMPVTLQSIKYDDNYETFLDREHVLAIAASTDPDTMYFDQAMNQPDSREFINAAIDEITTHNDNGHWAIVPKAEVPQGTKVLDAIWSMKRKRRLTTNKVYKHKARLNVHGGQQEYGKDYWETYAPVVTWASIRLLLILTLMYGWYTKQIDFVLAYPQADVETELFMKIPRDFSIQGKTNATHVLKLIKNLYGQKQAGRVWNKHLHNKLCELGWKQSKADECVYYYRNVVFLVYVDDGILISPEENGITSTLEILQQTFNISVEGTLSDYVGVNVEKVDDDTYHLSQPNIINSILKEVNFGTDTKAAKMPSYSTTVLGPGTDKESHKADWGYRRIIGKLNFLAVSCRPEISCAVHQAARYSHDPRTNHTDAVRRICRYLKDTPEQGMYLRPNGHSFEVYADADFCGLWGIEDANKPVSSKSRTGYVVMYSGCPIIWASQLQSEIALSTTEAEYIALSTALRQTIPLMRLVKEIKRELKLPMDIIPKVFCRAFEDNTGAVELSNVPKLRPRTKHISTKYHHFRKYIFDKQIQVEHISTKDQIADIFTKNLPEATFIKFRNQLLGWNDATLNNSRRGSVGLIGTQSLPDTKENRSAKKANLSSFNVTAITHDYNTNT